jgi:hypothetical protein
MRKLTWYEWAILFIAIISLIFNSLQYFQNQNLKNQIDLVNSSLIQVQRDYINCQSTQNFIGQQYSTTCSGNQQECTGFRVTSNYGR